MDIHNYKKNFERTKLRIQESPDISKENKDIALSFSNHLLSENIGLAKINRYLGDITKFNSMLKKPFSGATKEDIRRVVGELNETSLAEETKKGFKIMLRKLYRFIRGIEEKGVYPEEVKWISIRIPNNHKKLPEEMLTEDEILRIIRKCNNLRDKALLSALAESGCRVSEIGTMQIKHVSFEQYGARLTVNGKTGMRKILVINCTPYLQEWINQHPFNDNPESPLWVQTNGNLLCYARITAILKEAVKSAGIKKRVYPHLFRHSKATHLASFMSDSALKDYLGWTQGSKMAATYIHMSGKETDNSILEMNGIEINNERKESKMKPTTCLRCKTVNEATNRFCKLCGLILDEEEAKRMIEGDSEKQRVENVMDQLVRDKDIIEMIKKKLFCSA